MNNVHSDPLVHDYLRRLDAAASGLPADRRADLVAEIREHIHDALQTGGPTDEVTVRNVLERLGEPDEIVAAALDPRPDSWDATDSHFAAAAGRDLGGLEIAALITLAVGGLILSVIGVIVGLVLCWASTLWTRKDKWVATALPAAFILIPLLLFVAQVAGWLPGPGGASSASNQGLTLLPDPAELLWGAEALGSILGGLAAAVYLAIQARRRTLTIS